MTTLKLEDKSHSTKAETNGKEPPVVGIALGSGSARGWAHIGILQELEAMGIVPQVVAGTSIGALVGAVYVSGQMDAFADWVKTLSTKSVFGLMDVSFNGGVVKGDKLFSLFQENLNNPDIETLDKRYMAVATEMYTGREHWLQKGSLLSAARASYALPGLFSPVHYQDKWLLDGGLINPVPISLCRAMGAEVVIAVNLNASLMSKTSYDHQQEEEASTEEQSLWQKIEGYFTGSSDGMPSFFDVVSASINTMQDRITRSRMAGDPPDILLEPRFDNFSIMDFHRAEEAIEAGRKLVRQLAPLIKERL